jgi:hypothetical protein
MNDYVILPIASGRLINAMTVNVNAQANCVALASAYAARFGGSVGSVWCSFGGFRGFSITGISEAGIAELAKDDRVEFVEPDMVATTS